MLNFCESLSKKKKYSFNTFGFCKTFREKYFASCLHLSLHSFSWKKTKYHEKVCEIRTKMLRQYGQNHGHTCIAIFKVNFLMIKVLEPGRGLKVLKRISQMNLKEQTLLRYVTPETFIWSILWKMLSLFWVYKCLILIISVSFYFNFKHYT